MNTILYSIWSLSLRGVAVLFIFLGSAIEAQAHGPFGYGFTEQIQNVKDSETARKLYLKLGQTAGNDLWSGSCAICHLGGRGGTPRNVYGNAMNTFLSYTDYNTPKRIKEAGRRVLDIPTNPSIPDSPTFGEMLNAGELPVPIFSRAVPTVRRNEPAPAPVRITIEDARKLVKQIEAESRFGILQLSKTDEISPDVAAALAEFRGEFLILGIRSLTPEVASALAQSRAANVWLHNITNVPAAATDAIIKLRGHLVLTGLTELTSPALAEKLAKRPGALSFPYMKSITLPIATALVTHEGSLTLSGLTTVASDIQDKLAEAKLINLPSLKTLDSEALTERLAESWRIFLPDVDKLTLAQAKLFANSKGQKMLSAAAMTDEVTALFSQSMSATSIVLFGNSPISNTAFASLLKTRFAGLELRDIDVPTDGQITAMTESQRGAFYPQLKKLNSERMVKALLGSGTFPSVTEISPEAADAMGKLPEGVRREQQTGGMKSVPSGQLFFPSLEELSPETARLLLQRRWLSLSFPALQDYSVETIRTMAKQSPSLTLGLTTLPPELATAYAESQATDPRGNLGGLMLPNLLELSPEAARILVKGMNRGVEVQGKVRITKTPALSFGSRFGSMPSGLKLSPELSTELSKFEGNLMMNISREFSPKSAAPFATFTGPYLQLFGSGTERLAPETAATLAKIPGRVILEDLKVIDSIPLCDKNTREGSWYWNRAETVTAETVAALIRFKQWFNLDGLTVLDSAALAQRLIEPPLTGGRNLHGLERITPEAAEVFATFDKPLRLGLTILDDVMVAQKLARSKGKIELKRLKAATPEVIAILKDSKVMETPNIDLLYVLSTDQK